MKYFLIALRECIYDLIANAYNGISELFKKKNAIKNIIEHDESEKFYH